MNVSKNTIFAALSLLAAIVVGYSVGSHRYAEEAGILRDICSFNPPEFSYEDCKHMLRNKIDQLKGQQ